MVPKFWAILQVVVDGFWGMGYFSDPVDVCNYEEKTFFSNISSLLTVFGFYYTASILKLLS